YIGNRSSGRQGVAVALAAADRGADVTLVVAHVETEAAASARRHPRIQTVEVGTAADLQSVVGAAAVGADVVVMAAAVSDYRVAAVSDTKLAKETDDGLTLELVQNPDILAGLAAARPDGQTIVGFAAETEPDRERLLERGRRKRERKGADLLVVNEVGWSRGFEQPDNAVAIIGHGGHVVAERRGSKREIADALWDVVVTARRSRNARE
ncbi:phosphopantothenoylcysteine decarboxylase, partial [Microbacterium sp. UBA3394]